jgi:predicted dehydrogenase
LQIAHFTASSIIFLSSSASSSVIFRSSRKAVRNLEVYGEQLYIHWDGSPTGLYVYDFEAKKDVNINLYEDIDQLNNYSSFVVENAYLNEIISFFEAVTEGKISVYNFEKDKDILKIIDRIEA